MLAGATRRARTTFSLGSWLPIVQRTGDRGSIALTFDDGPSRATTPGVLHLLRAHDVRATFFLCGHRVDEDPSLVSAMIAAGHEVFAHGYRHTRLDALRDDDLIGEMERSEALLRRHRPTPSPYMVRLPYGAGHRDARVHRLLRRWHSDCQIAHWDYDFKDFLLSQRCGSVAELETRCDQAVSRALACSRFRGAVVLLHEDPIGAEGDFVPLIATKLLGRLLQATAREQIAVAALRPSSHQSWLARSIRTARVD